MGAWYTTREAVKAATDVAETARNDAAIDRAIEAASREVDRLCNRNVGGFWPSVRTRRFDWPNRDAPSSTALYLDEPALVSLTSLTTGGATIATGDVDLYPDDGPPFTRLDLDTTSTASFGAGQSTAKNIAVVGVWGYDLNVAPAGILAASVGSTSTTTIDVSDSGAVGVGDLLTIDTERVLVTGRAMVTTGQTLAAPGLTALSSATTVPVSSGAAFTAGETILIDAERMLVVDVASNNLIVRRAQGGSVLAVHTTGATVFAPRRLTVTRGAFGTTAATHSSAAAVSRHVYPGKVVQLTTAEALAALQAEGAAWARTAGQGPRTQDISGAGAGLDALREQCSDAHGRNYRMRSV